MGAIAALIPLFNAEDPDEITAVVLAFFDRNTDSAASPIRAVATESRAFVTSPLIVLLHLSGWRAAD
jgi:hypothetical protein